MHQARCHSVVLLLELLHMNVRRHENLRRRRRHVRIGAVLELHRVVLCTQRERLTYNKLMSYTISRLLLVVRMQETDLLLLLLLQLLSLGGCGCFGGLLGVGCTVARPVLLDVFSAERR